MSSSQKQEGPEENQVEGRISPRHCSNRWKEKRKANIRQWQKVRQNKTSVDDEECQSKGSSGAKESKVRNPSLKVREPTQGREPKSKMWYPELSGTQA